MAVIDRRSRFCTEALKFEALILGLRGIVTFFFETPSSASPPGK